MSELQYGRSDQSDDGWRKRYNASPLRITTGVFGLIFAVLGLFIALAILFSEPILIASTPTNGLLNFLLIVGSVGSLVTSIVLLAKQRRRAGATPYLVAAFSIVGCISALLLPFPLRGGAGTITACAALVSMVLSIATVFVERRRTFG